MVLPRPPIQFKLSIGPSAKTIGRTPRYFFCDAIAASTKRLV
jgi:hypothetical protein